MMIEMMMTVRALEPKCKKCKCECVFSWVADGASIENVDLSSYLPDFSVIVRLFFVIDFMAAPPLHMFTAFHLRHRRLRKSSDFPCCCDVYLHLHYRL